ncbi:hypothetical protein Tsp_02538 [Trichinella spiralis]|uniref:hypothetical protein n=1 Tax=Trichinella spiralis TaxID=6334 RepID=UPI0001EFB5DF|nr:hypothetical protein Tsp_02538 [Trichinella spiralis]
MVIFTNKKKAPLFDKQVTLDLKKELQRLEKCQLSEAIFRRRSKPRFCFSQAKQAVVNSTTSYIHITAADAKTLCAHVKSIRIDDADRQQKRLAFVRVISKQQVEEGAIEHSLWPTLTILGLTIAADDRPVWRRKANLKQNVNYIHTVLTN